MNTNQILQGRATITTPDAWRFVTTINEHFVVVPIGKEDLFEVKDCSNNDAPLLEPGEMLLVKSEMLREHGVSQKHIDMGYVPCTFLGYRHRTTDFTKVVGFDEFLVELLRIDTMTKLFVHIASTRAWNAMLFSRMHYHEKSKFIQQFTEELVGLMRNGHIKTVRGNRG